MRDRESRYDVIDTPECRTHPTEAPLAPRTSVLIVTRDCVEPLRRCLAALEAGVPREAIEIIVVDNGSQRRHRPTRRRVSRAPTSCACPRTSAIRKPPISASGAPRATTCSCFRRRWKLRPTPLPGWRRSWMTNPRSALSVPLPRMPTRCRRPSSSMREWKGAAVLPELSLRGGAEPLAAGYVRDTAILVSAHVLGRYALPRPAVRRVRRPTRSLPSIAQRRQEARGDAGRTRAPESGVPVQDRRGRNGRSPQRPGRFRGQISRLRLVLQNPPWRGSVEPCSASSSGYSAGFSADRR